MSDRNQFDWNKNLCESRVSSLVSWWNKAAPPQCPACGSPARHSADRVVLVAWEIGKSRATRTFECGGSFSRAAVDVGALSEASGNPLHGFRMCPVSRHRRGVDRSQDRK